MSAHRAYLPNLDGLRALAIALVLLHHGPKLEGPLTVLQENGRYGVALFFAISGYLITTLLLRERESNGRVNLGLFYARRSVRLFPLYYGALVVYALLVVVAGAYSAHNRALFLEKLPAYVFYYSNLVPNATQGPFFFAWSLATEEQFYLAFGLAFRFLPTRATVGLVGLTLAAKLLFVGWVGSAASPAATLLLSVQESILLGVLAAMLASARPKLIGRRGTTWVSALVLLVLTALGTIPLPDKHAPPAQALYGAMAALVYLAANSEPVAWLEARPVAFLGRASYALYLIHMLFLESAKRIFPGAPSVALLIGSGGGVAAAAGIHVWIELPLARLRARFAAGAPAPPGARCESPEPEQDQTATVVAASPEDRGAAGSLVDGSPQCTDSGTA